MLFERLERTFVLKPPNIHCGLQEGGLQLDSNLDLLQPFHESLLKVVSSNNLKRFKVFLDALISFVFRLSVGLLTAIRFRNVLQ